MFISNRWFLTRQLVVPSKFIRNAVGALAISLGLVAVPQVASADPILFSTVGATLRDYDGIGKNGVADSTLSGAIDMRNNPLVEERGIIEFDISSLSGQVLTATLNLVTLTPNASGTQIDLYGYVGDGILGLGDFALGSFLTSFIMPAPGNLLALDVTDFINAQIDALSTFGGFVLRNPVESAQGSLPIPAFYGNAPFGGISNPPTLTTTAVPEPSTIALFGAGLLGLATLHRRRRRKFNARTQY